MGTTSFSGTFTALVTPFDEREQIDYESLSRLTAYQIDSGVQGLVILGTTGEAPALSPTEREALISHMAKEVGGRLPLVVGVGANSTHVTLENMRQAKAADAYLVVAPYYNKPTQEGLFLHFSQLAESTQKPIVLYSHPGRCGVEISVNTVCRLRERYSHICAIKEAGGGCDRVALMRTRLDGDFAILAGDDGVTLPFMALGAKGVISVTSNLSPVVFGKIVQLALKNDFHAAETLYKSLYPIISSLACVSTNPIPIKYVLWRLGFIASNHLRLPLCPLSPEQANNLDDVLEALKKASITEKLSIYA